MTTQDIALTVFGRTDIGKKRTTDEDTFVISDLTGSTPIHAMTSAVSLPVNDRGVLIAVSDGMGRRAMPGRHCGLAWDRPISRCSIRLKRRAAPGWEPR